MGAGAAGGAARGDSNGLAAAAAGGAASLGEPGPPSADSRSITLAPPATAAAPAAAPAAAAPAAAAPAAVGEATALAGLVGVSFRSAGARDMLRKQYRLNESR